ncbi:hypothetical protein [Paenibacillus sp. WLX2291]|uniref:hypothetical protein n=1 Tax=Paenibacillus sp. WLX2291 TaxID=3296934 RepID=UPI00398434D3
MKRMEGNAAYISLSHAPISAIYTAGASRLDSGIVAIGAVDDEYPIVMGNTQNRILQEV